MRILAMAAAAALMLAAPARAEVVSAAPDRFELRHSAEVAVAPGDLWQALVGIGAWWESEHTYSGDAANMRLTAVRAGGCFCETWGQNSVEHGRIIYAHPGRALRLDAALGPLQEMAVTGVLTFQLTETNGATRLILIYVVSGAAGAQLDQIAPLVDAVLGLQFARLKNLAETGSPG